MFNITIIGLTLLAVFTFFILQKKVLNKTDYVLLGINTLQIGFLISGYWVNKELHTTSFLIQSGISFLLFPAFSLYALLLSETKAENRQKWWWFWVSPIVSIFIILIDFLLQKYTPIALIELFENPPLLYLALYKFNQIFIIACCIWILKRIKIYKEKIRDIYSNIESIRLEWLKQFTWVMMGIHLLTLVVFLVYNFHWIDNIDTPYSILNITYVVALFFLSINGIKQYSVIELIHTPLSTPQPTNNIEATKTPTTSPSYEPLYQMIKDLIEQEKLFLDPQLQVQQVAERLQVNAYKVSKAINSNYGKPFFDFINTYRVAHLQKLLVDPALNHLTILALGLDSGFNSKASLNRIFKQHTGITPRAYQKSQLDNR